MQYTYPDYYKEFHCIADACEDTCCAGWQIAVDKKSMKKYSRERGTYRWKLWKSINWLQSTFRQSKDLRCAFLKEDNLCEMYQNLGEQSLYKTCRTYPRHIEEFEDVREITLSISCPVVAKMLMNRQEPVHFRSRERECNQTDEYENFDPFLYSLLVDAREVMIQILQDRTISIPVRTQLILGIAHDMQNRITQENLFACYEVIEKYQTKKAREFVENDLAKRTAESEFEQAKKVVETMEEMELLRKDWFFVLEEAKKKLFNDQEQCNISGENQREQSIPGENQQKQSISEAVRQWQNISEEFQCWLIDNAFPWEIQKEQILVYFISTYFCGAVYDGHVFAKAQLAATSVLIIEELLKSIWLRNEKTLDMEDVVELIYRFSREIEHSDDNLYKLMKAASMVEHHN